MIQVYDKLQENNKTKDELLSKVIITKTNNKDIFDIIPILYKCFSIESEEETVRQLLYSNADLENSVKLVDKETNEIYGILIFSRFPMEIGSPIMSNNYELGNFLKKYSQINGYAFIIDERLRGTSLDKRMLLFNNVFLSNYDFIWCAVEKSLKSHNYWKKLGFIEILEDCNAYFYVKPKCNKLLYDIFIIKSILENYENNNIR